MSTPAPVLVPPVLALLVCCAAPQGHAAEPPLPLAASGIDVADTRMLAQPALSAEHVAFVYAGDVWVAARDGGGARRLTSHAGSESRPRFSPDGAWVAFSGQYDGNTDVFVVPVGGGAPRRLTWHPGPDVVQGFTPDGSAVLFHSGRATHTTRHRQLFTVPVEGGHPTRLPIPHAFDAAWSPDGTKIAYTPLFGAFHQWKNYRGGTTSRIWIYDVADHSVEEVSQPEGRCNDADPAWLDGRVWFRSDRGGEFDLYSYDPATDALERHTESSDFPVLALTAGDGAIVYEQAGWLHTYTPGAGSARLAVGVPADRIETRPRWVSGAEYVRGADVSPSGARAVFEFRGELLTLPAEKGDPRALTRSAGAHERGPVWSPDGRSIAWFSDEGGEYGLHVGPQDGRGEVRRYELAGSGFYDDAAWSPDGERISFVDNSWTLYVLELETGAVTRVGQESLYGPFRTLHHAWSPDSRWIAYTLTTKTYMRRVHLYDVERGESHALTDGLADVSEPVFDASGEYLYFAASTDAGPARTWFAMSNADVEVTNALYLCVLAAGTPSPLGPESDEEEIAEEEDEAAEAEGEDEAADETEAEGTEEDERVVIDFDGLAQRIVALPLPPAYYSGLAAGADGKLFYVKADEAAAFGAGPGSLARFDLESREETVLAPAVAGFALTPDGGKMLVAGAGGDFWIAATAAPLDASKGKLAVDRLRVRIDPAAEWPQIFDEAWRINRDWFYDPGMHGADWTAMRAKYAEFLPHLAVRSDLNRLIQWMCSELGVGHHGVGGGDTLVEAETIEGGLLGADYEVDSGRYRFARVLGGLNWTPELRAPLTEPGVDVREGEYLLAVDGLELFAPENLYGRFEGTAGTIVELTVGPNADGSESRTVEVVPVPNEAALRNRAWVEGNIARVTEATGGRVAYVYVPNTAGLGHVYFKRYFFPQSDRDAIIVDERHNGGGQIADYYIDILRRPYVSHWAMRYGDDLETPQGAIRGPKVMLIDETAGSGGDLLPWMFRDQELGTLVGRRTWGGLVGVLGFPTLMDGGSVTAPNVAFWTEDGFLVENVGVPPDVEVEQWPAQVIAGHDPQLEAAIEIALRELEANPPAEPERPPFPVRVRR